ncbi:putative sugar kinase YdjH [Pseudobythopirellula maris]|uniref:Putative sugar kinase YdjH n=1 Tax=Pseudobythopirellula maris TaxID=2527991 RepID=A0A5C5ZQ70_9BACT|nr:carbohydrate kinase family protein [Pseudobythopirellula maris]TWT89644.1 putative sugar kinase YdjH [Pseudobythopirellula maris]
MQKTRDVVVCGSCVVDVLVRPVPLDEPLGAGRLVRTEPLVLATGGIVSNAGVTLARLGMSTAAFTYLGDDAWADVIRSRYAAEGLATGGLLTLAGVPTSTTAVMIDPSGERTFLHAVGAPKRLDKWAFLENLDLFAASRAMLLGYFSLLPALQDDLPEVLAAVRGVGCMTALDAAGTGGTLAELAPSLPHLDLYVPSHKEASHQTGEDDPERILATLRDAGAAGVVGVKLGGEGALLSERAGECVAIAAVEPPGAVVDTTGAGDCFIGGLLCGLLRGMPLGEAGRLAAACGARCVTALGATTAAGDYESTARLAGLGRPQ